MARIPRCLVQSLDAPELDTATRHHLGKVLRLAPDAPLELVDGRGGLASARWAGKAPPVVQGETSRVPPPRDPVWLAVAPPRPSRLDWLVEKAAELGVDRLLLTRTEHAARSIGEARTLRLQRKAHEAMLQCRRLHGLQVVAERPLAKVLDEARDAGADLWAALAPADDGTPHSEDPNAPAPPGGSGGSAGGSMGESMGASAAAPVDGDRHGLPRRTPETPLLAVVGPEGGFSPDEIDQLTSRGAHAIHLGAGVLRVETAALALAARLCR